MRQQVFVELQTMRGLDDAVDYQTLTQLGEGWADRLSQLIDGVLRDAGKIK